MPEAIAQLDQVIGLYPDYVPAWSGRGILQARLGHRQAALRDAEEALRRDASPPILYQVAGIYALTSKDQPEDRLQAFRLLSIALRAGFGWDLMELDPDLDPIREDPRFDEIISAAQALEVAPGRQTHPQTNASSRNEER